jgi:hypothetical protein
LVTLPVAVFFLSWLLGLAERYRDFQLRYDLGAHSYGLQIEGESYARQLWRRLRAAVSPQPAPDLPVVELFLDYEALARLDRNLPHSGFEYVKGQLFDGERFADVKMRYRGDFHYHWAFDKKSLRIKMRKGERFHGLQTFNLIVPKFVAQTSDVLGYQLASHLGLLRPDAKLAWVYVNGACRGLHLMIEQIEESTLRANERMPGDIYVGEMVAKDQWQGIPPNVFDHPFLWEKVAVNNHFPPEARGPLSRLCELLAMPQSEWLHEQLGQLLDIEAFGRMAALESLIGSYHTGEAHNWRLYWDPWRLHFEPIIWDPTAYGGFERLNGELPASMDPHVSRLHLLLMHNASFLAARHRALQGFLESSHLVEFNEQVDQAVAAARFACEHDPLLLPAEPEFVRSVVDALPGHVRRLQDKVRSEFLDDRSPVRFSVTDGGALRIEVADRVPVTGIEVRLRQARRDVQSAVMRIGRAGEVVARPIPLGVRRGGSEILLGATLHAQLAPTGRVEFGVVRVLTQKVAPTTYDLLLQDVDLRDGLLGIDVIRSGGERERAERAVSLPEPQHDFLFASGKDTEVVPTTVWQGLVELQGETRIRGELVISAGSVIHMGPSASLIVEGRVFAEGSEERPIRFVRSDAERAWGTVALRTRKADDSSLRHVSFDGGSGHVDPQGMYEYSAMFSVHDCQGVRIEQCSFTNGSVVDDMVHVVYGDIDFHGCRFVGCPSDAVDIDISRARFVDCDFERSGNDGLDLMTSRVTVDGCDFVDCGDKGISVGEGSRLLAVGTTHRRCLIGVQAKDGSRAALAGARFDSCQQSLDAYRKNWRYAAGGTIHAHACTFVDDGKAPTADAGSHISIARSSSASGWKSSANVSLLGEVEPPVLAWLDEIRPGLQAHWATAASQRLP